MGINREWHAKNKMPKNPTPGQRIKWHIAHQEHCACRAIPPKLAEAVRRWRAKSAAK